MSDIKSFAVLGGDRRMLYCARALADDGFIVTAAGFSGQANRMMLTELEPEEAVSGCEGIILPLPASKDGVNVFAPMSEKPVPLFPLLNDCKKVIFCGMSSVKDMPLKGDRVFCYSSRDDFKAANALPTAEGAVAAAMREYDGAISSSRMLVIGYGRIGRVLSSMLRGMGASVNVSARKPCDLEMIHSAGLIPQYTDHLSGRFDIIFNTVPALVLDSRTLARIIPGGIIIDLASMPGGVDDEAAKRLGIRVYHELSLPGRVAPKTAGEIIRKAVMNIIREEGL